MDSISVSTRFLWWINLNKQSTYWNNSKTKNTHGGLSRHSTPSWCLERILSNSSVGAQVATPWSGWPDSNGTSGTVPSPLKVTQPGIRFSNFIHFLCHNAWEKKTELDGTKYSVTLAGCIFTMFILSVMWLPQKNPCAQYLLACRVHSSQPEAIGLKTSCHLFHHI